MRTQTPSSKAVRAGNGRKRQTKQRDARAPERHVVEEARGEGPRGQITMSSDVVAMVAGIAARQIDGIHSVGKSRLINFGTDTPTRGVAVEVGQKEAAIDLEVIIEHGCNLRKIADELRNTIAEQVDMMTGRKVVEVNIEVIGIEMPETTEEKKAEPVTEPRVH